jgi:hypothetical protein
MAVTRIYDVLKQLRSELARVDYLIRLLETMALGQKQRGRPPKFLNGLRRAARDRNGPGRVVQAIRRSSRRSRFAGR